MDSTFEELLGNDELFSSTRKGVHWFAHGINTNTYSLKHINNSVKCLTLHTPYMPLLTLSELPDVNEYLRVPCQSPQILYKLL